MRKNDLRPVNAVLLTVCTIALTCGCSQAPIKRFKNATHVDAVVNPGWWEFNEPFAAQFSKLKEDRDTACVNRDTIEKVYAILSKYEEGWIEYWAVQPESPPVTLRFHQGSEWLGTVDVYEAALGLVGNKIHRALREDTARILELICDCPPPAADAPGLDRY